MKQTTSNRDKDRETKEEEKEIEAENEGFSSVFFLLLSNSKTKMA
jgi:hypothetical protein